jgi:hypothetical protein
MGTYAGAVRCPRSLACYSHATLAASLSGLAYAPISRAMWEGAF